MAMIKNDEFVQQVQAIIDKKPGKSMMVIVCLSVLESTIVMHTDIRYRSYVIVIL